VISSDVGALLAGATDKAIGSVRRFAAASARGKPELIEHRLETLVGQRVVSIAPRLLRLCRKWTTKATAGRRGRVRPFARHRRVAQVEMLDLTFVARGPRGA
jgi:hypothetical protein